MPEQTHHLDPEQAAQFFRDMNAEGEAEEEFHPGIAGRIASKTIAAGALMRNQQGEILFVTPVYKPYLEIPGGVVDSNESPHAACQRELREELSLDIKLGALLVVDWVPQHGVWRDSLQLIFDGGTLTEADIEQISLPYDELQGYEFARLPAVEKRLRPSMYRRLSEAVDAATSQPRYTEFGR